MSKTTCICHFTQRVLFLVWSAFAVTSWPSVSPISLLAHPSFETFDFSCTKRRPRTDPQHTNLCKLNRAESMFITCMLVKLWSSYALAVFRFKCLHNFKKKFLKKQFIKNLWQIKHFLGFHTLIQSREIFQWQQISTDFQLD